MHDSREDASMQQKFWKAFRWLSEFSIWLWEQILRKLCNLLKEYCMFSFLLRVPGFMITASTDPK